jgi:peptidoglycan/LPS O-acetylase OafA/YrhL
MTVRAIFRPDLEGLRAVAVLLVLLYHARVPGVQGGYVGVDVFFVLSGFLITGLLVRELVATGRVDLPAFYARRARRLLPAASVTLLVTIALSAVMLPPLRVPDVAGDTIAAAFYVSNIRFAIQATDYLGSALPPSPVLHFWSLGVEEQFYLFWPALLLLVSGAAFRGGHVRAGLRHLAIALVATFVLSLAASMWLTDVAQPWAFFSLPTRAWELALGALLALPAASRLVPAGAAPWMGWAGLVMVVVSGLILDEATQFPGVAALLPTVGSALVIASGLRAAASAGEPAETSPGYGLRRFAVPAAVLGLAPMRFLGRISYSLYLWHWPILVLPAVALGEALPGAARAGLAVLAIVVAAASQRWIEDPVRHGRFVGLASRRSLVMAGVLPLVVALSAVSLGAAAIGLAGGPGTAVGGGVNDVPLPSLPAATPSASPGDRGSPPPSALGTSPSALPSAPGTSPTASATLPPLEAAPVPADLVPSLTKARDDLPVIYSDGCHLDVTATSAGEGCVYGDVSSPTTVVLFGDSHAAQWFPALERLSREHGWRLLSMTKSACTTADATVWSGITKRAYAECDTWRQAALDRIAAEHPALVVVSNSRTYQVMVDGVATPIARVPEEWDAAQGRTLARLSPLAQHVVVIGDTPRSQADPPVCLSANLDDASACAMPYAKVVDQAYTAREAAVAASAGVGWVDPTAWVCRTDPCPVVFGRFLVFRDQHHLTATYARALATRLDALLPPLAR